MDVKCPFIPSLFHHIPNLHFSGLCLRTFAHDLVLRNYDDMAGNSGFSWACGMGTECHLSLVLNVRERAAAGWSQSDWLDWLASMISRWETCLHVVVWFVVG